MSRRRGNSHTTAVLAGGVLGSFQQRAALAGMPAPFTLTDAASLRLQTISFFLMLLLFSAAIVRLLWNYLATSFPRLPRLTYGKALSLVLLWSLMFAVVLVMISGGRELMTPGAWERRGPTYRLVPPSSQPATFNGASR